MGSLIKNISIEGHADQKRLALVRQILQQNKGYKSIIEVGCADGAFAYQFALLGLKVYAIDLDCSVAKKKSKHRNAKYFELDAENLTVLRKLGLEADCVHIGELLEHVNSPTAVLDQVAQCTKSEALYIISVPNFLHPTHKRTYTLKKAQLLCSSYFDIEGSKVIKHSHKKSNTERYLLWGQKLKN